MKRLLTKALAILATAALLIAAMLIVIPHTIHIADSVLFVLGIVVTFGVAGFIILGGD